MGIVFRVVPTVIPSIDELELPLNLEEDCRRGTRPRPRDRHDGIRQEHDAGRDGEPHQPHAVHAHHDGGGSDSGPPPRPPVAGQSAGGRRGHPLLCTRAPQCLASGDILKST